MAHRARPLPRRTPGLVVAIVALAALGLTARSAPLFDHGGRLLQQFPTEDGYLMLTVARNLAIGKGLSVADGTIPTNGVQPLATLLYAGAFVAADGDRRIGVGLVQGIEILIAIIGALALYRLGLAVLRGRPDARAVASLASAGWFASPVVVRHGMNGLETGLYMLAVVLVQLAFVERDEARRPWNARRCAATGVLLGIAFWARNDAVFLIAAACVTYLSMGVRAGTMWRRLPGTIGFGAMSVLIASPWLAFNLLRFGHLMPVSGRSESFAFEIGENLPGLPAVLVEYLSVVAAIPESLQTHPGVAILSLLVLIGAGAVLAGALRSSSSALRSTVLLTGLFGLGLATYYGAFFGVGFFLSRYMAPLSPALALLATAIGFACWRRLPASASGPAAAILLVIVVTVAAALHARIYRRGVPHMHFQVVEWVEQNVPEATWVGAVQTGTLGFFHDRTLNLDGKVNPEAQAARERERIPDYVVEKDIQYLADWVGIDSWMQYPVIAERFDVVVRDPGRNLAVLRRHGAPRRDASEKTTR